MGIFKTMPSTDSLYKPLAEISLTTMIFRTDLWLKTWLVLTRLPVDILR